MLPMLSRPATWHKIRPLARMASAHAAKVVYPVKPPQGQQSGRVIDDQLFTKMAHIPPEDFPGPIENLHDEEELQRVTQRRLVRSCYN